jgi:hypothetical protein
MNTWLAVYLFTQEILNAVAAVPDRAILVFKFLTNISFNLFSGVLKFLIEILWTFVLRILPSTFWDTEISDSSSNSLIL